MQTKRYPFPFPVADTNAGPVVTWAAYTLSVEFTDYQAIQRRVVFHEVPHFEFVSEDELDSTIFQYDGAVEVLNSPLISKLVEVGEITASEAKEFQHLAIGFNEIGSYLVVVCRSIEPSNSEQFAAGNRPLALQFHDHSPFNCWPVPALLTFSKK